MVVIKAYHLIFYVHTRARENVKNANVFIDEHGDTMRDQTKSCLEECICTSSKVEAHWFRLIRTCPHLGVHTKTLATFFYMLGICKTHARVDP